MCVVRMCQERGWKSKLGDIEKSPAYKITEMNTSSVSKDIFTQYFKP